MKKRLTAFLLTLSLAAGMLVVPVLAAAPSQSDMIQVVNALGIMIGDEKGNMNLGAKVTRAEYITMVVKATPGGDRVGQAAYSPFPDVPYSHWASGYVAAGVTAGYISGYTDGTFRPGNQITLAEGVTIVLSLLGYTSADFQGAYPQGQLAFYQGLNLNEGMTVSEANTAMTRQDAMRLFYNTLTARTKGGSAYLTTLGYTLGASGEVDVAALINATLSGPVVATGDWKNEIGFDLSAAKIYRGNSNIALGEIVQYDVVYWSNSMRALWVYSDRVTGAVQSITPTRTAPTGVTVAGRSYAIESSAAAYAFSNLGTYDVGDRVTLLLGREGGVAGVVSPSESAATGDRIGIVTALDRESYTGPNGDYFAETVTVLATDGLSYSYPHRHAHQAVGNVVRVSTAANGDISISRVSTTGLSGQVTADGAALGGYPLAAGVQILDVAGETGARVYPARIAGLTLERSDVRYYELNAKGEITCLVLDDVTGDMNRYGIITKVEETATGTTTFMVSYTIELAGEEMTLTTQNKKYAAQKGPFQLVGNPAAPEKMTQLKQVELTRIEGGTAFGGNRSYTLSDSVQVYEYRDHQYLLSSVERVTQGGLALTGWYDKPESEGGLIRVIVAQ